MNEDDYDDDKSDRSNFGQFARAKFLYMPFIPLPSLADCVQYIIEVK